MFAGLLTKLALGAVWGKVKANASHDWQAIPPKVRLWLLAILAALALFVVHQWYAKRQVRAAFVTGYTQAMVDLKTEQDAKTVKYKEASTSANARIAAKHEGVQKNAAVQNTHIDSNVAALLRLYTAPTGGGNGRSGTGVPGANAGAGALPAQPRADDGLANADIGGNEPTIAVPAKQLITRSGICDRDYIALKAWEQTYRDYRFEYDAWLAKVNKLNK